MAAVLDSNRRISFDEVRNDGRRRSEDLDHQVCPASHSRLAQKLDPGELHAAHDDSFSGLAKDHPALGEGARVQELVGSSF